MMILRKWKEKLLNATGMIILNDNLFFHSIEMEALLKINIQTGKLVLLQHTTEFKEKHRFLYTDLIYVDDKLYLCPTSAESIAIYDDCKGEFIYKNISAKTKNKLLFGNDMSFIMVYEHFLFFIGICQTDIILKFDIETDEVEVIDNQFIDQYTEDRRLFTRNAIIYHNKLVIPLYRGDILYILDICSQEKKIIQLEEEFRDIMTIDQVKDDIVMTTKYGEMLVWDNKNHRIVQKEKMPSAFYNIISLVNGEEILFYLVHKESTVMRYSLKSGKVVEFGQLHGCVLSAIYNHDTDSIIVNTACGIYEQHKDGTFIKLNCEVSDNIIENIVEGYHAQVYYEGNPGFMTLKTFFNKINSMNVKI